MDEELRNELTQLQRGWLEHLQSWERSGSTLKAYAERHSLDHRRLYRFKRLLTDKGVYGEGAAVSPRFIRARIAPEHKSITVCRVRLGNGCVVEIDEPSAALLEQLLRTVSALP